MRFKWLLIALALVLIDIGPIPITASLLVYVLLFRPAWFKAFADRLYSRE